METNYFTFCLTTTLCPLYLCYLWMFSMPILSESTLHNYVKGSNSALWMYKERKKFTTAVNSQFVAEHAYIVFFPTHLWLLFCFEY